MATAATARAIVASCTEMLHAPPVVLAGGDASDWGDSLPAGATIVALTDIAGAAVRSVRTSPLVLLLFGREVPHPVVDGADRVVALDGVNVVGAHNDGRVIVATTPADESAATQLARRICRRTVGLALGSGALRGFAHAGVLATFEQRGVPIDFMSGASAGSIAGSLYLTGTRPDDLARLATLARGPLAGGLPRVALSPQSVLPGRRLRAFLRSRLRETSFEDLTTPFTVAATDLVTRRAHYIENGSLVDAVAASSAVPGLFPPVLVGGTRMVDGGSSDPVPVGRLRERGADIVVAVNVMRLGNDLLGMKLPRLPIPLPLPAVITNLLVGLDSLMVEIASHTCKHADVTIEPTLAHARWYDVLGVMDYRDAGAEAAEAAIPRIRRLVGALAA